VSLIDRIVFGPERLRGRSVTVRIEEFSEVGPVCAERIVHKTIVTAERVNQWRWPFITEHKLKFAGVRVSKNWIFNPIAFIYPLVHPRAGLILSVDSSQRTFGSTDEEVVSENGLQSKIVRIVVIGNGIRVQNPIHYRLIVEEMEDQVHRSERLKDEA